MVASLALVASCSREPAQTWMLGVFSSAAPGRSEYGGVQRSYVSADGRLEYQQDSNDPIVAVSARTWIPDGDDSIMIFPGPGDEPHVLEGQTWTLTKTPECDVYEYQPLYEGQDSPKPRLFYRGEVCVRSVSDPCEFCDRYERYWCDQPPPPCGDDGGDSG